MTTPTSPTSKEVLDHLLANVLDVDAPDIKALSKAGIKYYRKLVNFEFKDFDTLREDGDITMSCWRDMTDFKLYVDATNPSKAFIMAMTSESWDSVDIKMLRINQSFASTAIAASKPTLTADTVTPSQIETIAFLKYVHISLLDKNHILQFYNLLLTQACGYNIFLRPTSDITSTDGI